MDEVGAKVENEAVIVCLEKCARPKKTPKILVLDSPFWLVMQQKGKHPYFLTRIGNTEFMKKR